MYPYLYRDLQNSLTSSEWAIVGYYISKADSLGKSDDDSGARKALEDAIAVALSKGEQNAAHKIQRYLRFY